ncbi:hypothetical protein BCR32DRAFT_7274 [Anaeromyces robustus]|uniref:Uncharacterized protein n=1 Tax=Anaeromyces robustus TaxID=1754192 RepID=A0A1Y1XNB1_9FUNG|nr:hypothetical protein BCR32DRAFT_7274 [Anaeromyces robustus]|eukprot:ORX87247.1 hypothetical protein BCR32DRAFT_7274 [Anaeromyces robustus]
MSNLKVVLKTNSPFVRKSNKRKKKPNYLDELVPFFKKFMKDHPDAANYKMEYNIIEVLYPESKSTDGFDIWFTQENSDLKNIHLIQINIPVFLGNEKTYQDFITKLRKFIDDSDRVKYERSTQQEFEELIKELYSSPLKHEFHLYINEFQNFVNNPDEKNYEYAIQNLERLVKYINDQREKNADYFIGPRIIEKLENFIKNRKKNEYLIKVKHMSIENKLETKLLPFKRINKIGNDYYIVYNIYFPLFEMKSGKFYGSKLVICKKK